MKNPWKRLSKINPQPEDGTRRINNKVFDALVKAKLPTAEMSVVLIIISKSWGFGKNSDVISTSQFVDATGLTSRAIKKARQSLKCKRIIHSTPSERVHRGSPLNEYLFNKHYDTWKIRDTKKGERTCTGERKGQKRVNERTPTKEIYTKENIYSVKLKQFVGRYISFINEKYKTKAPKGKNVEKNSLETLDKIIRLDGFQEDYVFNALRWAQKDDFWKGQIYSLAGLRKKSNNGLTKFQNLSNAYDKEKPEEPENLTPEQIRAKYGLAS